MHACNSFASCRKSKLSPIENSSQVIKSQPSCLYLVTTSSSIAFYVKKKSLSKRLHHCHTLQRFWSYDVHGKSCDHNRILRLQILGLIGKVNSTFSSHEYVNTSVFKLWLLSQRSKYINIMNKRIN